ncbi:hypothetical protein PanWU01x14_021670, partial [Parasponia andersonii]
ILSALPLGPNRPPQLTVFKTRLIGKGIHTLIKSASFPFPADVGFHNPPLKGSASPLTIDSGTGSDTICNSPRIPLADIVRFATWTKPPSAAHGFQNASDRERYPHPYKECFVPLSSRCGISQLIIGCHRIY